MGSIRLFRDFEGGDVSLVSPLLRWTLLVGVMVHFVGFMLFRVVSNPLPTIKEEAPFIVYLPEQALAGDALLEAQASLFDTAPLFIPTPWSAAARVLPDFGAKRDFAFKDYLPSISLIEALKPGRSFGLDEYSVSQPEDLLALHFLEPLASFGQDPPPDASVADWQPFVELRLIQDADQTVSFDAKTLSLSGLPQPEGLIRPIRAYVSVSTSGRLLSRPFLVESSGSEAIDAQVMEWLMAPETIAGLPSSYLEVSIYL